MTMPVSSASSPELTAGSIATTILARCGVVASRVASIRAWLHNAPGVSSSSSALSSCRPSSFVFADDLVEEPGREVRPVLVSRAPGDRNTAAFAGEQFADQPGRPRRRGKDFQGHGYVLADASGKYQPVAARPASRPAAAAGLAARSPARKRPAHQPAAWRRN